MPRFLFLLFPAPFLLLAAAHVASGVSPDDPAPTPWPDQFHAVLLANLTASGGRLQVIDVYYDWPRGRSLNVIRGQLSDEPLYNVEWVNGSSYTFDGYGGGSSCNASWYRVGILPPDWILHDGAAYVGRRAVDGFDCHIWSHSIFRRYYIDVATGRPVFWDFAGSLKHVLSFELGGVPQEDSPEWQAPASCFSGGNDGKDPCTP